MAYETEEERKKKKLEEPVRRIEVIHRREGSYKTEATESPEDAEFLENAKIVATVGFASEKRSLAQEFPKYANQIRECKTPIELAEIMEEIETNEPPKSAPSGAIKLKPSEIASSIRDGEKFKNPRDLMNDIVHKMAFGTPEQKRIAKRKYETLLESMLSNPSIRKLATTKRIVDMPTLVECPRCGSLMEEGERNCPMCKHAMGATKRFISVSYAPSKLVKEGK